VLREAAAAPRGLFTRRGCTHNIEGIATEATIAIAATLEDLHATIYRALGISPKLA
jgi:hypothetical protein